ncbi:hypothetical protein M7I_5858 [Glarea lozoyensis 74030]|uniref:Uncharacterized protein n=1 Tax=Glarea lozoyensis (strain ATCC 74030 / MF5533) TaxID=1104152 RepID=H0ESY3_GLAL7|nr:hypothetical protein M7I_5858 [Glarea lozoyensis 74030]
MAGLVSSSTLLGLTAPLTPPVSTSVLAPISSPPAASTSTTIEIPLATGGAPAPAPNGNTTLYNRTTSGFVLKCGGGG